MLLGQNNTTAVAPDFCAGLWVTLAGRLVPVKRPPLRFMETCLSEIQPLPDLSEPQLQRLAQELAFLLRPGDAICLHGELGAGKTTLARALIRAVANDERLDIPSPTFTLVQNYETARFGIAHFDLYRLSAPEEIDELGLDHALTHGAALIEWPERAEDALPADRLDIFLSDGTVRDGPETRSIRLEGRGLWEPRALRLVALHRIVRQAGFVEDDVRLTPITGDASARHYARLTSAGGDKQALVMDWPRQPDGPPIRGQHAYSQIAHLAEGTMPFVAIAEALRATHFSAPEIFARDLENGFLVLEDLGEHEFKHAMAAGTAQEDLWRAATDTLVALRAVPIPAKLPAAADKAHVLPPFDKGVLGVETELLLDWYWPAIHGTEAPADQREAYRAAWSGIFDTLSQEPKRWVLRDFHSPNLIWLGHRSGTQRVGLIDFQDALAGPSAYDLVSLLQDARIDVDEAIEARLLAHYIAQVQRSEPGFDPNAFRFTYAALGAQRNTKILGIFARLARRDGKLRYLAHIPRVWGYLTRDLAHPELAALAQWYDAAFPPNIRAKIPVIRNLG